LNDITLKKELFRYFSGRIHDLFFQPLRF